MIAVYIINFCLIFPAVLTVAYHITDLESALADPTLYPTIWVLRQAMSPAWLTVMLTIVSLIWTSDYLHLSHPLFSP
jgi:choline transport protein